MKKISSILFYILILILSLLLFVTNKDYDIYFNSKVIHNDKSFLKYKDYKFINFNLDNIIETRFDIEKPNKENNSIYTIKYNNKYILLELTSSTASSGNILLMKMDDNNNTVDLKETLKKEKGYTFYKGYYTNNNVSINKKVIFIKLIINIIFIGLSFLLLIINIIKKN